MRFLVLGSGLQGSAAAFDLLTQAEAQVTLADAAPERLSALLTPFRGRRLSVMKVDAQDHRNLRDVMRGHDAVLCALPYYFNFDMAQLAVELGIHFADLGGNTDIVRRQETLHDRALQAGVSVVPDCGLAPGLVNVLAAEGIRRLDRTDTVRLYVGGLPQHPEPPLNYTVVYSLEGVLDYYTTPSWIVRGGVPRTVEALSETESVSFPAPVGELEAFHTAGGISTMPWRYAGCVQTMEYKTLRYPGHAAIMRAVRDLGLLSNAPVDVKGIPVVPRDAFMAVVGPRLRKPNVADLVALRVVVSGTRAGQPQTVGFRLLDQYDAERGVSAMMRTTGYSLAITAMMQAQGKVTAGARPAYDVIPFQPYVEELAKRGIAVLEDGRPQ
ncbi:MAG TPA: saccharopine dehydrogenase C-terminal domain-containing protein [Gemmatimonadales bacterium]|nr:saccharopine dehydrogenase C-terminal domain-containing protein [Gemmatimonadales bacterium]